MGENDKKFNIINNTSFLFHICVLLFLINVHSVLLICSQ